MIVVTVFRPDLSSDAVAAALRHGLGPGYRVSGATDYWSKLELGWHVSPTQNHRDAIETVEIALRETERLLDKTLLEIVTDHYTGEVRPVALVTDNGPCFKAARFAAFIDRHPELMHIRTKRKSPGQNGVRERAFGSLKYEHLYREEIDGGHQLGLETERYRQLFNTIRHTEHWAAGCPSTSTSPPARLPRHPS